LQLRRTLTGGEGVRLPISSPSRVDHRVAQPYRVNASHHMRRGSRSVPEPVFPWHQAFIARFFSPDAMGIVAIFTFIGGPYQGCPETIGRCPNDSHGGPNGGKRRPTLAWARVHADTYMPRGHPPGNARRTSPAGRC
jgi:hypothetical protein